MAEEGFSADTRAERDNKSSPEKINEGLFLIKERRTGHLIYEWEEDEVTASFLPESERHDLKLLLKSHSEHFKPSNVGVLV